MDGISLQGAIDSIAAGARTAVRYMPEPYSTGVDFAQALAKAGLEGSGSSANVESLLNQQIELQQQMLQISLISNVERTKHEIKMAPVRNIRLS